ncbi:MULTISPECIES: DUF2500 domain-containing protein [unclassified Brenneria]|uniref:DUF2500 domain-containing protein n=1 Tax=unclassified Brenneria TaxID=2634434 RepID=UPI0029C13159|nr:MULTISPECIES: DUF2500 domain-containing protein [unclassified Brenneria]MDX5630462.1 DUF2500 domain-containing protein [Brenneria sp. L3-3Z]MDX5697607.1 DUF2500 domain-containing protein [Brenneria sp. L4-2C]MEE3664346.1 DUF2500 domain-containing protein [Brenneria sp. g21c3]
MRDFHPLLILALALIAVLAWRQYQQQRNQEARNDAAVLQTISAQITAKREFPRARTRPRDSDYRVESMFYEATFQPLNGGPAIALRLDKADYNRLDKDMRGMLQVKGTRFVGFRPGER